MGLKYKPFLVAFCKFSEAIYVKLPGSRNINSSLIYHKTLDAFKISWINNTSQLFIVIFIGRTWIQVVFLYIKCYQPNHIVYKHDKMVMLVYIHSHTTHVCCILPTFIYHKNQTNVAKHITHGS